MKFICHLWIYPPQSSWTIFDYFWLGLLLPQRFHDLAVYYVKGTSFCLSYLQFISNYLFKKSNNWNSLMKLWKVVNNHSLLAFSLTVSLLVRLLSNSLSYIFFNIKSSSHLPLHGCSFTSLFFSVLLPVTVDRVTYLNMTEETMAISKLLTKLTSRGYVSPDT